MTDPATVATDATGAIIASRYRVEAQLARGGMGAVYRVEDLATGQRVALKQLIDLGSKANLGRMFEREYHTLKSLAHPRIIEVYEYGRAGDAPYYTMELLDGKDLRDLAPLSYTVACRHLHDVASSIALLHARRLLHRDLSPRNVRVTSDGRCKLIDFGALTSFGLSEAIVGTPPLVPPEALHHAPLDQRADLYSLGALAYWLLTKRHAFPVSALGDLTDAWRHPPLRPSEVVKRMQGMDLAPIPKELDDLVMSLLTLNPLGRPASAAEVMDRFVAIGGLTPDRERLSSQSYLRSPALVGRDRELERLDKRLRATLGRKGSCMVVEAASGMGSSRLLAELALRAQLLGALPVLVDASLHRGPYGVVHDLIDKLLKTAALELVAAAGKTQAALLARFSAQLAERLSVVADATNFSSTPGELRRRTQQALSDMLVTLSERRPLLLLIDQLQHADDLSVAVLATLAHSTSEHPLFVVVAHDAQHSKQHAPAIKTMQTAGSSMRLRPLSGAQVGVLVRSLFGDVPHAGRLAEWLRGMSGGSPGACLDSVQHLVERDVVRYVDGMWVLPQELRAEELPASLEQVIGARLSRLTSAARALSEALSVHNGAFSLSRCLSIAEAEGIGDAFAVIETLVREGVLVQTGENYHFGHESLRARLLASLEPDRLGRLHAQLGALLLQQLDGDLHRTLEAGWHLLHGGQEAKGAELLAKAGIALDFDGDQLPAAIAPLTAALSVYRKQKRSPYEMIQLLAPLCVAGLYTDRRLGEQFGDETIALFKQVIGLSLAEKLRPALGKHLALYIGLGYAGLGFLLRPGRGGIRGLVKTIGRFLNCVITSVGAAAITLDGARCQRFTAEAEIFTVFGRDSGPALPHRLASLLSSAIQDRQAQTIAGLEEVLKRLRDPRPILGMPEGAQSLLLGSVFFSLGALDPLRTGKNTLLYADELEKIGIRIFSMAADQIRANHHSQRGESALTHHFLERVELHAVQLGSSWQAEVWAASSRILSQGLCRDRLGLKHTMETLDRLSIEIPSLARHAKLARAMYCTLTGDPRTSYALRKEVLESAPPRALAGWATSVAGQAHNLRLMGKPQEAKQLVESSLALLDAADRTIVVMTHSLFVELALAEAALGDLDKAGQILDEQLAEYGNCEAPLVLGNVHNARAQVALRALDGSLAAHHLAEVERWYRPTENPNLIALCEQLRREVYRSDEARPTIPPRGPEATQESVRSVLSQCKDSQARADRALLLLLEYTGGANGYLFAASADGPRLLSPTAGSEPSAELQAQVRDAFARSTQDETTVEATAQGSTRTTRTTGASESVSEPTYRLLLLSTDHGPGEGLVGAAAIARGDVRWRTPHPRVLQAIAEALSSDAA